MEKIIITLTQEIENSPIITSITFSDSNTLFGFSMRLVIVLRENGIEFAAIPTSTKNSKSFSIKNSTIENLENLLNEQFNSNMLDIQIK